MKSTKDISQRQFEEALSRHGFFGRPSFLGYVHFKMDNGCECSISVFNSGTDTRRGWLAWLIQERRRINDREAKREACQKALKPFMRGANS